MHNVIKLSIVIPTYNRNDLLSKCLASLNPQCQTLKANYEIIVSDDSRDANAKVLIETEFPFAKWVQGPKVGPAANRNNGARFATGDWIVFIDDDCIPNKNLMEAYLNAIMNFPDFVAFEGRIYVEGSPRSLLDESPTNETGGCFWSCNICIKRNLFEDLNGFDDTFPYAAMEDVEFFYRIRKITDKYKFLYDAAVLHPWRTNTKLSKTAYQRYKSILYFLKKHPEMKLNLNPKNHFNAFFRSRPKTFRLALQCNFAGIREKLKADAVWIWVGLRFFFDIHKK
ncbi:glycosyltransferase family 2 protein [Mucilaginibacter agri]|uniref:Glycosyltransferase n=1 Tax=Mucilaginibacter agri TaxID=2695265 RepID=A0A965ZCK9_9SPHI|nr:glycosyltransferase [Mucilaginibacter agri]NCD67813.1 glycosyltransferase [Mucilaginibacter agri]